MNSVPDTSTLAAVSQDVIGYATSLSIDVFIVAGLTAGFMAAFLYWGKKRGVALILALLFAILLFDFFPFQKNLIAFAASPIQESLLQSGLFVIIVGIAFIFFKQMVTGGFAEQRTSKWLDAFLLSLSAVILLLLAIFHAIPFTSLYSFGEPFSTFIGNQNYFFWWIVAALVAVYISTRSRHN